MKTLLLIFIGFLIGIYSDNLPFASYLSKNTKDKISNYSEEAKRKLIKQLAEELENNRK